MRLLISELHRTMKTNFFQGRNAWLQGMLRPPRGIQHQIGLLLLLHFLSGALIAASVDHFGWAVVASPQAVGVPFATSVTAYDSSGNWVSNYSGSVTIRAEALSNPTLLISEVDIGNT